MTAEVEVPSGPSKGDFEGSECNGANYLHEEGLGDNGDTNADGKRGVNGCHVLVAGSDGVGGSDDDLVEADLSEENVVGSVEKDRVNGDDKLKVENGVNGDCSLEGVGDGVALEQEEPGRSVAEEQNGELVLMEVAQGSTVGDESEGLLIDAAGTDSSVVKEQNGTVEYEDRVGSIADAESEGVWVYGEVIDSSTARELNGTLVPQDQEQESTDGAESGGIRDDVEVTDSSLARELNGTVASRDQEQENIYGAESEGLLDGAVSDSGVGKDDKEIVAPKDQVQESIVDAESEGLLDGAVSDSGVGKDHDETLVSEDQVQGSAADSESEGPVAHAAMTDSGTTGDQNGTVVSSDRVQECIGDAVTGNITDGEQNGTVVSSEQVQECIGDAVTGNITYGKQNGTVVFNDLVQENICDSKSEGPLIDSAVTDSIGDGELNGAVVSYDQVQENIGDAESERPLVDAAVADGNVSGEQNGNVVSEEQEQGIVKAAEPEGCLVDARDENGLGSIGEVVESENGTVAVVESEPAGGVDIEVATVTEKIEVESSEDARDIQVSKDLPFDSTYCGGDCKAPLLDAGKLSNGEESNLDSAGQLEEGYGVASEELLVGNEVCDGDENHLDSTNQIEENGECEITIQSPIELELRSLNADGIKDNQESPGTVDLELEKKPGDLANKLIPDVALGILETNSEQNSKAVSFGDIQTVVINGGLNQDHPKRECTNIPVVDKEAHFHCDDHSNIPEETSGNNSENVIGQPADADALSSDNVLGEANSDDVETRDINDIESAQLSEIDTRNLVEDAEDGKAQLVKTTSELVKEDSKDSVVQVAKGKTNEDGEFQLVKTTSEFEEDYKDSVVQVAKGKINEDGEEQLVKTTSELVQEDSKDSVVQFAGGKTNEDGEAQLVKTTSELVEEDSKASVVQVAEGKTNEEGEAQLLKATSELVGEEFKERVVEVIESKTNEEGEPQLVDATSDLVGKSLQGSKNKVKPDMEDTDVQQAEANSKLDTVEIVETNYISNGTTEAEASVDQGEAAEIETEVGETVQPTDADEESFCTPSGPPVEKKPFYFMIRMPRFDDKKLREEIALSQFKVAEKSKVRNAIMAEIQPERIISRDLRKTFQDFASEQKELRDLLRSKQQEINSQQFLMNKVRDAMSMDEIDERIHNLKNMIEHESRPLKEEKQYVREMEKLKQTREDLSSNMGKQEEVQQTLEQKGEIEKQLKLLRKEVDSLREKFNKVQHITTAARKKLDEHNAKLQQLEAEHWNADQARQQEYSRLQSLWEALNEKNKYMRKYRDDVKVAYNYASVDKEALQQHCVNQVESFMELWNKNDEFRNEYVDCNLRSTLWRLGTHDGRALGPEEEPPIIPIAINRFANKTMAIVSTPEEEKVKEVAAVPVESEKSQNTGNRGMVKKQKEDVPNNEVSGENRTAKPKPGVTAVPKESEKSQNTDNKGMVKKQKEDVPNNEVSGKNKTVKPKSGPVVNSSTSISGRNTVGDEEASEEVTKVVVEDEMARKAEVLRKEEEASKLAEQLRLEQKAKAKEALERKKKKAEKAQVRAEFRAKKELEKKVMKMEKKKAAVVGTSNETHDVEQSSRETPAVIVKESEHQEKPTPISKRAPKPSRFIKSKHIPPPPLRNRGKRRMKTWMWFLISALLVFALFLLASSDFLSKLGLHKFVH